MSIWVPKSRSLSNRVLRHFLGPYDAWLLQSPWLNLILLRAPSEANELLPMELHLLLLQSKEIWKVCWLVWWESMQVTPERIAFMVNFTSGLICVPMPKSRLDELGLPLMVESRENEEAMKTAFTVTVDARDGVSTGISAMDRCRTIRLLSDPSTQSSNLSKPGHILPLVYALPLSCIQSCNLP